MNTTAHTPTLCDALENAEARRLIDCLEDMRASWDGENRYAFEIQNCADEIFALTGYRYSL